LSNLPEFNIRRHYVGLLCLLQNVGQLFIRSEPLQFIPRDWQVIKRKSQILSEAAAQERHIIRFGRRLVFNVGTRIKQSEQGYTLTQTLKLASHFEGHCSTH
jgi:hypothetical protein